MFREAEVYLLSEQHLTDVIAAIGDDRWGLRLPEWFALGAQHDRAALTLRAVVNYHAYDTAWVPDTLAGHTIAEVGAQWDGDLLGDQPATAYAALAHRAVVAVQALPDPQRTVHLTYGEWPAREYLTHITSFRAFRAYDIARLVGRDPTLPADLVQGMWEVVAPQADAWRQWGVFGPEVPVPADAPLHDRLFGRCGRDPSAR